MPKNKDSLEEAFLARFEAKNDFLKTLNKKKRTHKDLLDSFNRYKEANDIFISACENEEGQVSEREHIDNENATLENAA